MMSKRRWLFSGLVSLAAMLAVFSWTAAQETKTAETAAAVQLGGGPEQAPAPPAGQATLPDYFAGENPKPPAEPKWPDPTGGNAGAWATPSGTAKPDKTPGGDVPSALTPTDLYDRIAHNLYSINIVWTLVTGFLVMFMQAGFACVETGLCRAKNAAHTFSMNFMIYPLGCLAFWAYGFAIGWGNWYNGEAAPGWYPSLGGGAFRAH